MPALRDELMLDNRPLWSIGFAVMIRSIGFGATWPFMAIFFNRELKVPIYEVGLIFAMLAVSGVFFQIFGGYLADFRGRRFSLLFGSASGIVIYTSIIILLLDRAGVVPVIALFILTSISGSIIFPAANAYVADVTSPAQRSRAYSIYRILANTGWAVGPLTGSQLFQFGIVWIFLLVDVTLILQFTVLYILVSDRKSPSGKGTGMRERFAMLLVYDSQLLLFSGATFLLMILVSQFSVTLPSFAITRGSIATYQLGYIYAVNGLVVVFGQFPVTSLVRNIREMNVVIFGALFYMLGYFLLSFSGSLLQLMFDMAVITIGENLATPGINAIVSRLAPSDKVGRYMAFNGMANSAGRAMGPTVGSILLFVFAYDGLKVWSFLDMFGALAILLMLVLQRMRNS
ncbi:MAG: MFS transporter [Candidatus Thermoplasmatota archaeon]|jgi:MFS family permease|nr:MFS transporter [Candidatus Sysuiplasma jiujiangense]MBX8639415.1 MFS transporter [Candidatus Sysuiplasma jiujiangense]MBX8641558.1 MFS transporter [Candidatus Sysuiplasma jiujiangense]MCL4317623.1 MFS transporter [Candidatus Thermoplasmatota archaeon]